MNAWPFIAAAYGLTGAATAALVGWCWSAMRRAERAAEALRRR
ncbi:hypothetical protein GGR88_000766 [Sphingomonas jejuensis]|uniref:Heme exporter protein D n=1 Tax=Sphingomonas jejuensis TaxID=904715 RepID=A0ABX0XKB1_9SPHN|nr:hypothetical protein [Sphingomonas jejuensis]NJC33292.1 hypothetical protein [Sphingomonas jejuensis]